MLIGLLGKLNIVVYLFLAGGLVTGIILELSAAKGYKHSIISANIGEKTDSKVESDGENTKVTSAIIYSNKHKEEIIRECKNPNKYHAMVEQIIPLLPLLGILGTVLGLFSGLGSLNVSNEITNVPPELFTDMKDALLTTIIGIISSVILKCLDIVLVVPVVEEINTRIEILDAQSAQRVTTQI